MVYKCNCASNSIFSRGLRIIYLGKSLQQAEKEQMVVFLQNSTQNKKMFVCFVVDTDDGAQLCSLSKGNIYSNPLWFGGFSPSLITLGSVFLLYIYVSVTAHYKR